VYKGKANASYPSHALRTLMRFPMVVPRAKYNRSVVKRQCLLLKVLYTVAETQRLYTSLDEFVLLLLGDSVLVGILARSNHQGLALRVQDFIFVMDKLVGLLLSKRLTAASRAAERIWLPWLGPRLASNE